MFGSDYGFDFFEQVSSSSTNRKYLNIKNTAKANEVAENFQKAGRIVVLQFWMSAQPPGTVIENDALCSAPFIDGETARDVEDPGAGGSGTHLFAAAFMTGKISVRALTGSVSTLESHAAALSGCSGAYPCIAVTLR